MEEKVLLEREGDKRLDTVNEYARIVAGCLLFAVSVNLFVVPSGIYNGGVYGLAQIIRTLLVRYSGWNIPTSFDISGIINYLINIPLFYIAYRCISKQFFIRTIICLTVQTVLLSIVPIPAEPLFSETLLNVAAGGLMAGYGLGLMLRARGCSGGVDILGIYFLHNNIPYKTLPEFTQEKIKITSQDKSAIGKENILEHSKKVIVRFNIYKPLNLFHFNIN